MTVFSGRFSRIRLYTISDNAVMARSAVNLLMMWLLLGPPALCRAGVLVECCDHGSTETPEPEAAAESPCCGGVNAGGDSGKPAPNPLPRKCGICSGVCTAVVKPSDDSTANSLVNLMVLPAYVFSETLPTSGTILYDSLLCLGQSRPYPPSDLPLLI